VDQKQSWWQTLPGILTAAASVLTALTGSVVALHQWHQPVPAPAPTQSSAPTAQLPSSRAEGEEGVVESLPDAEWAKLKPDIDYDRVHHVITIEVYNETEWILREITYTTRNFGLGWSGPDKEVPLPLTSGSGKPRTVSVFARQYNLEPYINFDLERSWGCSGAKGIPPKKKPTP
jgi:hypothetical protein